MEYNLEGLSFENKIFLSMVIQFYPGDTNNIDEWITPDFVNIKKKKTMRLSPYSEGDIWDRGELLSFA